MDCGQANLITGFSRQALSILKSFQGGVRTPSREISLAEKIQRGRLTGSVSLRLGEGRAEF
jgi:hypothetical protein